ncbi:uncharacterized protein LOC114704705 isoform X2 [Peromyscus leucopus]|uniref:uncharacterized protein LOC114704705 isoform X2 n=1 Tax=Peromyscus leucopus TaxID=10041 RepID=UPI001884ACCF|nr:uncharacterized protein LOC114704705 isoform X2 [Peromyscus leucopus]
MPSLPSSPCHPALPPSCSLTPSDPPQVKKNEAMAGITISTRPRRYGKVLFFAPSPTPSSQPRHLSHDSVNEWIPESAEHLSSEKQSPVHSQKGWGGAAWETRLSLPVARERMFQMEKESMCQRLGTRTSEDLTGGHQVTLLTCLHPSSWRRKSPGPAWEGICVSWLVAQHSAFRPAPSLPVPCTSGSPGNLIGGPAHPASQVGMTHPPSHDSLLRCLLRPRSRGLGGHSPTSCTSPQPAGRVPTSPPHGTHPAIALPGGLSTASKKPRQGESRHQGAQPASPLPSGPPSSLPSSLPSPAFPLVRSR